MDQEDVARAAERIAPYARWTPLVRVAVEGRDVLLKLDHMQLSGSFKLRGALNALLGADERPTAVVTASGGNHGAAVATAARLLGIPATVYVPESVPAAKAATIERQGARLIRHGACYAEAAAAAMAVEDAAYVPAFDHPLVVAGQGTCAAEILAEAPEVESVFVAVGGGGLAAGTALNGLPVVAVEPTRCRALNAAIEAGRPVETDVDSITASALGASKLGQVPFDVLSGAKVESVLIGDSAIVAARDLLWQEFRLAVELAAAAPLAAWLQRRDPGLAALIICGGNADWVPA
ncbi:pyridoxal-phosphate dependent enzyme [Actinokineospora pegani]|uniref:pyridoxal-phosphate dependent enzyme n=1 Tax=Actinokineospora pegani TaxID=2654637 RepID=UPI0012EA9AC9|nr:pyridoxal-phosphate dependent enzyme [Actinokineospora pegani]